MDTWKFLPSSTVNKTGEQIMPKSPNPLAVKNSRKHNYARKLQLEQINMSQILRKESKDNDPRKQTKLVIYWELSLTNTSY